MPTVRVPASTANLGAGFDALGLALGRSLSVDFTAGDSELGGGLGTDALATDGAAPESHPAVRAFVAAGGEGSIRVQCDFPPGRGLGFSGAARVAGVVAAAAQRGRWRERRRELLALAIELEGHADNAAASMYGGLVAVAGETVVQVPSAIDPQVIVWIPGRETSTRASRTGLAASVPFDDAVFNVGRAAVFVAAWSAGDVDALRVATEDRLHQGVRLAHEPASAAALRAAVDAGAHGAWLSGSGPSIAALAADARTRESVVAALHDIDGGARVEVIPIAHEGAAVE